MVGFNFSKQWLVATAEQVVVAFVAAYVSAVLAAGVSATSAKSALIVGLTAVLVLVKSVLATRVGNPNSPSILK